MEDYIDRDYWTFIQKNGLTYAHRKTVEEGFVPSKGIGAEIKLVG